MASGVSAPAGTEVWVNTLGGRLWYTVVDPHGREKTVAALPGKRFTIKTSDREYNSSRHGDPKRDPFLNGRAKRVDAGSENMPPEYDAEQALEPDDLLAVFEKNGNAFQSAVKRLDERNTRRLLAESKKPDTVATVKQAAFLAEYVAENYRGGGATSTDKEFLASL